MASPDRSRTVLHTVRAAGPRLRWLWAPLIAAAILHAGSRGFIDPAPSALIPVDDWLSFVIQWFAASTRGILRAFSALLVWPFEQVRSAFLWLPWPSVILISAAMGQLAGGIRLASFCAISFGYVVVTGYWDEAAVTLSLVAVAVPLSVLAGFAIGIVGFRYKIAWRLLEPLMDLMQTIPTLAYLLPILAFFGVGPLVGILTTTIYAVPPMVRAVVHGLRRVPTEETESGLMCGSTRLQLLSWVLIPSAIPAILLGLNQTIMAGLSMVVIASMVAGVSDIGIEVYQTMKQAKFGQSVLAGLVIALTAMVLDRVSRGFAENRSGSSESSGRSTRIAGVILATSVAVIPLAAFVPGLQAYPEAWIGRPVPIIDGALDAFTLIAFRVTSTLKTWVTFHILLPFKIGLPHTIRPAIWGFEMTPAVSYFYVAAISLCSLALAAYRGWGFAAALAIASVYYYFGTTGTPWPLTIGLATAMAYATGGWRVASLVLAGLGFILLTGGWKQAMISFELCAIGVAVSFFLGSAFGFWAAANDRVSAFLRPVCDTLQTMPIFVFLIPAVMIFLVGDFTALVAIVLYAVAPSLRYAEMGIRNVPAELTEAARMMGTTRWQMLWQVQIPVALPELALGLNQTIMMALAMVVVASLVGAPGLGQDVMIALSEADTGRGLVAGLNIALIAIIFDRIIQSWSARKKLALGLKP